MGASGWDYIEPFDTDLATTLANLRRRVFDEGAFVWYDAIPRPARIADLDALFDEIGEMSEDLSGSPFDAADPRSITMIDLAACGTHSILDVRTVGPRGDVQVMPEVRVVELFGSAQPSRADFERVADRVFDEIEDSWNGLCVVLHDETGTRTEVAFWGISGD
jgi:hypothetical protein